MDESKKIIFQKSVIKKPGTKTTTAVRPQLMLANIFEDEDDESLNETNIEKLQVQSFGSSLTLKKSVNEMNKAIEEDSTVFDYDDVYDKISEQKNPAKLNKANLDSRAQPKYMEAILEAAAFRKRENDRRMERKIQKERDSEDPTFANKEAFVTEAYRKQLEERREEDELLRKKDDFDRLNAVEKQTNMSQFYRHFILNQNMVCNEELKVEPVSMEFKKTTKNMKIRIPTSTTANNETTQTPLDNENTQTLLDNETTLTPLDNENTQTLLDNETTQTPLDNENTQTLLNNENTQTLLDNENTQIVENGEIMKNDIKETKINQNGEDGKNDIEETRITEEMLQKKRSLGLKIYDKRNNEETIAAAIARYNERKSLGLLKHFLAAGIDND